MFAVHEFGLNYWNDRPRFSGLNTVVLDVCMYVCIYAGSGSRCPNTSSVVLSLLMEFIVM